MGGQIGGQVGGQVGGQIGVQVERLTAKQKVYDLIVANPKVTRKELTEILGSNESAVQKHPDALKTNRVIEREGGTRSSWVFEKFHS